MKRSLFVLVFLGMILLSPCGFLGAVEIELTAGVGNLAFDPDRKEPFDEELPQFTGHSFFMGNLNIKGTMLEKFGYNIRFNRDIILQNALSGSLVFDLDYVNFEFGPFIGILSTPEKVMNVGLTGGIGFAYPGIVFLSVKGASTIGTLFEYAGDYSQESGEIVIGCWLPYVIPSVSASIKNFTKLNEDFILIRDEYIRYQASAEIFAKNFPLTVRLDFGYETLARTYKDKRPDVDVGDLHESINDVRTDEIMAMFAGGEVKWQITKMLCFIAGYEMPIYTWSEKPVRKMISSDSFFYQCKAGVVFAF
jgi:hypothetical protein